jgi:hypothetical protein
MYAYIHGTPWTKLFMKKRCIPLHVLTHAFIQLYIFGYEHIHIPPVPSHIAMDMCL